MKLRVETTTEKTCQCHSMHYTDRVAKQQLTRNFQKLKRSRKKYLLMSVTRHTTNSSTIRHHQHEVAPTRNKENHHKAIYYYSNLVQRASSRSNSIHEWQQVRHQREICRIVARRTQQIEYRIKIVRTSERHATRNSHAAIIFYSCSACARRVSFWQRRCSEIFFLIHTSDGWLMMLFAQ